MPDTQAAELLQAAERAARRADDARSALAERWQRRIETMTSRRDTAESTVDQLDGLIVEHDDRQRRKHERAELDVANDGGVLVRPRAGAAQGEMRGRRARWARDAEQESETVPEPRRRGYRVDWPKETR
jgi:hypothetical protein